ncbi:MAG: hypothetical protein ABI675_21735 [Chitinophagaceae bacterium]
MHNSKFNSFGDMTISLFAPISIEGYVRLHLKNNPKEDAKQLEKGLQKALAYALSGKTCSCGNPIWVIGAAHAGYSCFTCITGEATPDDDYEIDQHINYVNRVK